MIQIRKVRGSKKVRDHDRVYDKKPKMASSGSKMKSKELVRHIEIKKIDRSASQLESEMKKFFSQFEDVKVDMDFETRRGKTKPIIVIYAPSRTWYWDVLSKSGKTPEFNGLIKTYGGYSSDYYVNGR